MIRYRTTWTLTCQFVMGVLIMCLGCNTDNLAQTGLSPYYFPVETFPSEGMAYIFQNKQDPDADPEQWRYQKTGPGRMVSINYDPAGREVLHQYDRFVRNGVVTDSLVFFHYDSTGQKQRTGVKVIAGNRFPFDAIDSTKIWLTHLDWRQPPDSLHLEMKRGRRFMHPVTWNIEGQEVEAIKFRTEDTLETEREGWTTASWTGEEIYVKGVGLVYYKRTITDKMVLEFELIERKK